MGNPHLGDRVAALVDDELAHGARDRVLAHIATCEECRAEVEAARALKRRLAALNTPRPNVEPSADLLLALLKLGESKPPQPPMDASLDATSPLDEPRQPSWFGVEAPRIDHPRRSAQRVRSIDRAPAHSRPLARRPLRVRAVTVGAVSMAAATLGSAVMLGVGGASPAAAGMTTGASQHTSHGRLAKRFTTATTPAVTLTNVVGSTNEPPLGNDAVTLHGIPLALPSAPVHPATTRAHPAGASTSAVTTAENTRRFGSGGLAPSSFGASRPLGGSSVWPRGGFAALP